MGRRLPANIKLLYDIIASMCVTFTLTVAEYYFLSNSKLICLLGEHSRRITTTVVTSKQSKLLKSERLEVGAVLFVLVSLFFFVVVVLKSDTVKVQM